MVRFLHIYVADLLFLGVWVRARVRDDVNVWRRAVVCVARKFGCRFFKREMYVLDMELGVVLGWVGHVQCVQLGTLWANRQTEETAKACHQYHMCQVHVPSEYFCSRHFIE